MVKRLFFAVILTATTMLASAQAVKEVTLIVSGDGADKTEATNIALRSAIEQAFGTFVSANTTILNDELVKDEIATISSGNIQKYKELGTTTSHDGRVYVMLEATVSVNKLVKYAQNKGSECEFAGATFGANYKLLQLRYNNARKSMENLMQYIEIVGSTVFDYELEVGEPRITSGVAKIPMTIKYIPNSNTRPFFEMIIQVAKNSSFSREELDAIDKPGYRAICNRSDYFAYREYLIHSGKYYPINPDGNDFHNLYNNSVLNGFVILTNNKDTIAHPNITGQTSASKRSVVFYKVGDYAEWSWLFYDNLMYYAKTGMGCAGGEQEFVIEIPVERLSSISKFIVEPKQ